MGTLFFDIALQANQPNTSATNGLSLLGWLAGFLVAAGVVTVVAWPLLNVKTWVRRKQAGPDQLELDALYNRMETEELALDELEFDHEAGALAESDYTHLKTSSQNVLAELEQAIEGREQALGSEYEPPHESTLAVENENSNVSVVTRKANPLLVVTNETSHRHIGVKKTLHCSECGTVFKPGDRFCSHCGAPLPVVCRDCGAELSPDDRFCAKCGATVRRQ